MKRLIRCLHSHRVWYVYAPYALLVFFVMAPLLIPGYILTLDMVFAPHPPIPDQVSSSYLFRVLLHVLSYIIPSDVIEKIILCLIIFLSALGAHRLMESITPPHRDRSWRFVPYVAGFFFAINPFVYERFMAGHYSVLLGYALLPWFTQSLLQFLQKPSWQTSWPVVVWTILISIFSIHTVGMLVLIGLVGFGLTLWQDRRSSTQLIQLWKWTLAMIVAVIVLSSYWLIPLAFNHGPVADAVDTLRASPSQAFATNGGLLNVLQLRGFWGESVGLFLPADQLLPLSGIWQPLIWGIGIVGIVASWRYRRLLTILFAASALVALIFALGTFQSFLATHLPLFAGYREPQKFVMVAALAGAYFVACGAWAIEKKFSTRRGVQVTLFGCILLLSLLVTPTMAWGFNGQLRPHDYPADWYTLANTLPHNKKILVLPWHLYMRFSFEGGRMLANPTDQFFAHDQMIINDNPEFRDAKSLSRDPLKQKMSQLLADDPAHHLTSQMLRQLGIDYIILIHEGDADDYQYIGAMPGITLMQNLPTIRLYKVEP